MNIAKQPCYLCYASRGIPGPRQCPICAGTGYILTDAAPLGGSDEMFDKPEPYVHPMDPEYKDWA